MSRSGAVVAELKDAIDDYEELIDLTKHVLNEIKAFGGSNAINIVIKKVPPLYNKLTKLAIAIRDIDIDSIPQVSKDYILAYTQYIALVSLPYEIDLLDEIAGRLKDEDKVGVTSAIDMLKSLREIYEELYISISA